MAYALLEGFWAQGCCVPRTVSVRCEHSASLILRNSAQQLPGSDTFDFFILRKNGVI